MYVATPTLEPVSQRRGPLVEVVRVGHSGAFWRTPSLGHCRAGGTYLLDVDLGRLTMVDTVGLGAPEQMTYVVSEEDTTCVVVPAMSPAAHSQIV